MQEPAAVNPRWRKSSYSDNGGAGCIEAGQAPGAILTILIRDTTQHGRGPVLRVSPAAWQRLTRTLSAGNPTVSGQYRR